MHVPLRVAVPCCAASAREAQERRNHRAITLTMTWLRAQRYARFDTSA
jgi:hypothetical protein